MYILALGTILRKHISNIELKVEETSSKITHAVPFRKEDLKHKPMELIEEVKSTASNNVLRASIVEAKAKNPLLTTICHNHPHLIVGASAFLFSVSSKCKLE